MRNKPSYLGDGGRVGWGSSVGGMTNTTYAELAQTMPTRELIRQTRTHKVTCTCDRCDALYAELRTRGVGDTLTLPDGCTCKTPEEWITCPSEADHI